MDNAKVFFVLSHSKDSFVFLNIIYIDLYF